MRINKFFAAALAATIFLASCAKEEAGDGNNKNSSTGKETYAGISIMLKESGNGSRAVGEEAGTMAEQKIDNITVYVIDDATNEMQVKTFTNAQLGEAVSGYRMANDAIQTTVGTKTVYVVANATDNLKAQLTTSAAVKTNALALTESAFYTGSFDGTPGSLTSMVMSGKSTSTLIEKQTADQAKATPVKVDISRNVAKIAAKWAASPTQTGGTLTGAQFALATKVTKSYLVAHDQTALYTLPEANPEDIDPSYFTLNFSPRIDLMYQNVNAAATAVNDARAWFALEHKPQTFLMGNTTMIVIRGTWTPTNGTVVTAYNSGNVEPITKGNLTSGTSFYVNKTTQELWSQTAYAAAIASPNYAASDFSAEYVNGTSYYQVNVKSGAADAARGVVRNNYYEMTINSITGPGDPTEVGGTDNDDENAEESHIAVSIKPLNWVFNQWGENLQ